MIKIIKRHALTALTNILKSYDEIDIFTEIYDLLLPNISTTPSESSSKSDKDEEGDKPREFLIKATSFQVIGYAFPKNYDTQMKFIDPLLNLLCNQIHQTPWNVKLGILEALKVITMRLIISPSVLPLLNTDMIDRLLTALFLCLSDPKYAALRASAVDVLLELSIKLKGSTILNKDQKALLFSQLEKAKQDTVLTAKIESIKQNL